VNNTLTALNVYDNSIGEAGNAALVASAHLGCTVRVLCSS